MTAANSADSSLDAEEYLHLAIAATDAGRNDEALRFAKAGLVLEPDNGMFHYLLGSIHAEIGMIPRAIDEIGRALQLIPTFAVARFQLGMLHLGQAEETLALDVWAPLGELGEAHPVRRFRDGVLAFLEERYADAVSMLSDGMERNTSHPRLNEQIEQIVVQARTQLPSGDSASGTKESPAAASDVKQHILLAGYRLQQEPR